MNFQNLVTCFAIGFFVISLSSNVLAGGSINIQWGKGSESGGHEKAQKHKKGVHLRMPLQMDIGQSINTCIIHLTPSITIQAEGCIFILKGTTGKSERHCQAN